MRHRLRAAMARALDADEVMSRPGVPVDRLGVAVRGVGFGVGVRTDFDLWTAVAEIPGLVADRGPERPHFERHRIAGADGEGGSVTGVDRRRELVFLILIEDLHHGEVVVDT